MSDDRLITSNPAPQTPPPPPSPIDTQSEDADGKNAWNFGSGA